ncbi:MAG: hypothetical protein IJW20_02570 [Clostridia bacterium]|nr:hypothetical protein [Clostridia bacterium]
MKLGIIILVILTIGYLIYLFRYYILWFLDAIKVTFLNQKGVKDIQKEGMNKRNLKNDDIKKYIEMSKKALDKLNVNYNRKFILNQELERHLRYSRFSEKYVLELLHEILEYMNLDKDNINLKINYISSKYYMKYAGMYSEKVDYSKEKEILINIQNDMSMDTVISILAHECTHYLLLSNNIKIDNRMQNECLTDITAIVLGFGKFMVEGYKISNRVIYDEEFHRSIKKDRVGYLSYKDVKYAIKNI